MNNSIFFLTLCEKYAFITNFIQYTDQELLAFLQQRNEKTFTVKLFLSRYDNLSYKDFAQHMQLSVNTIEKHIAKGIADTQEHAE